MSSKGTIQDYAEAIKSCWRKTTESVLETASLCAEASEKLKNQDKAALIKNLDFSSATFSKLVKIGRDPRLRSDPIKSLLPPNYSIVYSVAKLPADDLDQAIKDHIISP